MRTWKRRDLTLISGIDENVLTIACDSCGGIGEKDGDSFAISAYYVGKLTARVVLTEVLCSGSLPITITNAVCCEMQPTGSETIRGILAELEQAGLKDVILTGSTEENFATSMTAIGVTVVGIAHKDSLRFSPAQKSDRVVLFGRPAVGSEVDLTDGGFYEIIRKLLSIQQVREIVPVGSKGIFYEAQLLAELNQLNFSPFETDVDLERSAGPVTCLIALCDCHEAEKICNLFPQAKLVGELV